MRKLLKFSKALIKALGTFGTRNVLIIITISQSERESSF